MKKRTRPDPQQQLIEIAENAKGWAKILPLLPPKHRTKIEAKIAGAWTALQRREWPSRIVQGEVLKAMDSAAKGCDAWIAKSGESEHLVEARAIKNAVMWIEMALNDEDAPSEYATKQVDAELVGKCVHAWRHTQRQGRGAPTGNRNAARVKTERKPAEHHRLVSKLLTSLGLPTTPDAVRVHEGRHLK